MRHGAALVVGLLLAGVPQGQAQETWYPFPVEVWRTPDEPAATRQTVDYTPLEKAAQKWRICVSFPHMKDSYWLAANYGVADEARRLGVHMDLVQAGGYEHLVTQVEQVIEAVDEGAQGIVLGRSPTPAWTAWWRHWRTGAPQSWT